jgi:hypothetical protein
MHDDCRRRAAADFSALEQQHARTETCEMAGDRRADDAAARSQSRRSVP